MPARADRRFRRDHEHLDAAGVDGIDACYEQCVALGVLIARQLAPTEWGTKDFI